MATHKAQSLRDPWIVQELGEAGFQGLTSVGQVVFIRLIQIKIGHPVLGPEAAQQKFQSTLWSVCYPPGDLWSHHGGASGVHQVNADPDLTL